MFWIISAFILGIGTGWGIRGLFIKEPKSIICPSCGFRYLDIAPKCPWCNCKNIIVEI